MTYTLCPHCGKHTEGTVADRGTFLFVVCDECDTILGTIPKYFQKVTWKARDGEEEEKDAATGGVHRDGKASGAAATAGKEIPKRRPRPAPPAPQGRPGGGRR